MTETEIKTQKDHEETMRVLRAEFATAVWPKIEREATGWTNSRPTLLALYWWHRLKVQVLHAIYEWADRKSTAAENRMMELAKRHDW